MDPLVGWGPISYALAYCVRRASFFLPAIAVGLTSCAIVDQYSSHAVAYNIEAEQAQEQQLVLNIVRASLRRPMQFTSVTTITGSQSASATAGLTAPFGSHSTANTGTFGASVSGGPTFTVPVLDTQDFYRGMLQGIPGELVDLLDSRGLLARAHIQFADRKDRNDQACRQGRQRR